ncbi:MAG: trypsin-like peptidase domain-containing protein [Dehalococcoidales bacterium]|nr:trypsin-like peptidase domain-containing protein [Dehalococcoidales bacterium]
MKRCLLIISLVILVVCFTGCNSRSVLTETEATSTPVTAVSEIVVPAGVAALEDLLEDIYEVVNPSVVNIEVLQDISGIFPFSEDETPQFVASLGSGFVWDTQGHIVTNNHVVENADRITVTFYDGTIIEATLVGADPDSDLAVIKVENPAVELRPVTMGDSKQIKVGQLAVAIGNPFGYQNTMTVGFISGLGRLIPATENFIGANYNIPDIIQTDTSINPGNSGGVLLNDGGEVIGVTTAIASGSGSSSGVGFAIPSVIVQQVVPSLISTGQYQHAWLGISIRSLNPDLAVAMGLDANQRGALVVTIMPDSPAEAAGLQPGEEMVTINGTEHTVGGDVIIAYDGQVVKSSDGLITLLERYGTVGQTVMLTVLRDGQEIEVPITLGARPTS